MAILAARFPSQNIVYVTVNLPDINSSTLKLDINSDSISFEATAGK
jgi:hypothetical protein